MFRTGFQTPGRGAGPARASGYRAFSGARWVAGVLLGVCLVVPGCSGHRKLHKHPLFVTEADAANYLRQALVAQNADERREAIVRLSKTRYVSQDTVVRGFTLIAETDTSPSVRCAAIRGLGKSPEPQTVALLLSVLAKDDERPARVRAPQDLVRAEASAVLGDRIRAGVDLEEHREAIRATAVRLLGTDLSRDVRMSAAELLGFFQELGVLEALIANLQQRDFGVVHECERSLMRLTGQTHDHDPVAWRSWLAQTDDPFADAGRLDGKLRRTEPNWFRESWESTRRSLASFKPKKR